MGDTEGAEGGNGAALNRSSEVGGGKGDAEDDDDGAGAVVAAAPGNNTSPAPTSGVVDPLGRSRGLTVVLPTTLSGSAAVRESA